MSSAAKVGIFMLIILAIVAYFVVKIEDIRVGRAGGVRQVTAVFDNAAGLNEKTDVRIAGVPAGSVRRIELTEDGKARVILDVNADVQLYENASAQIANLGLLGEKYIELDPGTPAARPITAEAVVIRGGTASSIDDVTKQVSEIATDVKAITSSLRAVMAGPQGQQRLDEIVVNVQTITREIRELVGANRANVDATVANMRALTADLRAELPRLADSIDNVAKQIGGTVGENRQEIREIVDNLKVLSADLRVTTQNLNSITGQVKSGEGTVGKLLYSDEAHEKLTSALASVDKGVGELRDTLGRVSRLGLDLGIKADYYAGLNKESEGFENLGGSSRSAVTLRLTPNPERNRFYNVELSDSPRGQRQDKIVEETVIDLATGQSRTTRTKTTKFERDFLVSAQAGWDFDELALRIGLFDSTGGVGADYDWNDRLRFTGEVFDFGQRRDDNPHIRLFSEYTFRREKENAPRLFFTTGVDNALNDLAFSVGGGIRWRDDDLKYLLGSIPLGR
jgi:phospholipid/cholesterol/gamma-HCH transport system substrate-binding protein